MLRALIASFSFSLLLLLTACGGDGGGSAGTTAPAGTSLVSSVAVKGVIQGGVVTLQRWNGAAYQTVASTQTAADGSFGFPGFTPVPGELLKLTLAVASGTRMVCDAEHCTDKDGVSKAFGEAMAMASSLVLTSWVSVDATGAVTVMPITPVSTMLVDYAEALGGGHLKPAVLNVARSHIAALFRLTPEELLAQPGNIASSVWAGASSTNEAQLKITLLAAAFAELAGGDAQQMQTVIQNYSQSFIDNNGRLMELDPEATVSLARLFGAVNTSVALATLPAVQDKANEWLQAVVDVLRSGQLSQICRGDQCSADFDSQRIIDALGPLGTDVKYVLQANGGYSSLEQMLAGELNKFGWLASPDSIALAAAATKTITFSAETMLSRLVFEFILAGFPATEEQKLALLNSLPVNLDALGNLQAVLVENENRLLVTGTEGDLAVNLEVSLPALLIPMSGSKKFAFGLKGNVSNDNVEGEVDASLLIDAADTDFAPLVASMTAARQALTDLADENPDNDAAALQNLSGVKDAIADLAKTARFSVAITADKFRFARKVAEAEPASMLAMEGAGSVDVNMDGGLLNGHRIQVQGRVDAGRITLPNGSWFQVGEGDHLTFEMNKDGSFDAKFATSVLTLFTGEAEGKLANMGVTLSNLRDSIVTQVKTSTLNLGDMLRQLLADISGMDLRVSADMTIAEEGSALAGKLYKLRIHNTDLTVSQPDSDEIAMQVSLSLKGLLLTAGEAWWLFAPELHDLEHPAILISDDMGGAWRYGFDLSGLLAGL